MSASMEKIAVIEDDPGIRTVIRLALKGAGLGAVCEAALRRPALRQELVYTLGSLRLDKNARTVSSDG